MRLLGASATKPSTNRLAAVAALAAIVLITRTLLSKNHAVPSLAPAVFAIAKDLGSTCNRSAPQEQQNDGLQVVRMLQAEPAHQK